MSQTFYAVVPAGGAGTRLWPLSRPAAPKFLLDLTGSGRTLIQQTVDRLTPLADGCLVVTGGSHATAVARQVPQIDRENILVEPSARESMAAIGLAAAVLLQRHPQEDVILGSFAADHVITGQQNFARAVRTGLELARHDYIATIGIRPTEPSTGFGYIRLGHAATEVPGAFHALGFTEKPDVDTATEYLATGQYRWNAGMFLLRARLLLEHLDQRLPELGSGLRSLAAAWDTPHREQALAEIWPTLPPIAIDHALAEPVAADGGVAVVPGEFGWDDVGDFSALARLVPPMYPDEADSPRVLGERRHTTISDSDRALVAPQPGRRVVVLGIPDAVVVDTPDALLVTTTADAQRVKEVAADLAEDHGTATPDGVNIYGRKN